MPVNSARVSGATALSGIRSRNSSFGPTLAATARAKISSPPVSTTPVAPPSAVMISCTLAPVRISTPRRSADRRHGARDGAHAADGVSPGAALAVHLAEAMVQQHVGGARRRRRRVVADDAVEGEGAFDDVALEPAVEEIGGAAREEVEQRALLIDAEARHAPSQHAARISSATPPPALGGVVSTRSRSTSAARSSMRVVVGQPLGIAHRELRDRRLPLRQIATHQQIALVVDRPEVRRRPLDDLQPMPRRARDRRSPSD